MKRFLLMVFGLMNLSIAMAEVNCTNEPVSKWKNQESFQKDLAAKYKIKKFKITSGNCYEVYGWDKTGKKVEIYFNPITGDIVKQR